MNLEREIEKLKQQVEVFELSQEYSVSGSWKLTLETNELYWSENIFKMLGYNSSEVEPSYELFVNSLHPDDKDHTLAVIDESIKTNKPYELRHRIVSHDGTVNWFQERGGIVHDEHGNPEYMIGVGYIVNKEVALENEREQLIEKLEKAVAEIQQLQEIIPICSYCHQIRNTEGAWDKLEKYLAKHLDAKFSHGICPSCAGAARHDMGLE